MFGVDIVHELQESTPTSDVLYFAVAGKAVPANGMYYPCSCCVHFFSFFFLLLSFIFSSFLQPWVMEEMHMLSV
jgi:hypothetical protein